MVERSGQLTTENDEEGRHGRSQHSSGKYSPASEKMVVASLKREFFGQQGTWDEHTVCWPNMSVYFRAQPSTQEEDTRQWEATGDTLPNMGRESACPP